MLGGTPRRARAATPGSTAQAMTIAVKRSRTIRRSSQTTRARTARARTTREATSARRAVSWIGSCVARALGISRLSGLEPPAPGPPSALPHGLVLAQEHRRNLLGGRIRPAHEDV